MNRSKEYYYQLATNFDILSGYYKYTNPKKHIEYYEKHLSNLTKALNVDKARTPQNPSDSQHYHAFIRVLHASPNIEHVDIYINKKLFIQNLFFSHLTSYMQLAPGQYRIDIFKSGTHENALLSEHYLLMPGQYYTINFTEIASRYSFIPIFDKVFIPAGETRVNFSNLSPDAPSVDLAEKDGPILFSNVTFRSVTSYKTIYPKKMNLEIRASGTDNILLDIPKVNFKADRSYSIFAIGFTNGSPELKAKIVTSGEVHRNVPSS